MVIGKYVIENLGNRFFVLSEFRLAVVKNGFIWGFYRRVASFISERNALNGAQWRQRTNKYIIGRWTIYASRTELLQITGLDADTPPYVIEDRVRELLYD